VRAWVGLYSSALHPLFYFSGDTFEAVFPDNPLRSDGLRVALIFHSVSHVVSPGLSVVNQRSRLF